MTFEAECVQCGKIKVTARKSSKPLCASCAATAAQKRLWKDPAHRAKMLAVCAPGFAKAIAVSGKKKRKLTDEQVRDILSRPDENYYDLAKEHGVNFNVVLQIRRGTTYKDVTVPPSTSTEQ